MKVTQQYAHPILPPHQAELLAEESQAEPGCPGMASVPGSQDTRLRDIDRIARLTAMVCLALVWAYPVGEHKDVNIKAVKILKHGCRAESLVRYGLAEISIALMRPMYKPKFDVFNFFSCT